MCVLIRSNKVQCLFFYSHYYYFYLLEPGRYLLCYYFNSDRANYTTDEKINLTEKRVDASKGGKSNYTKKIPNLKGCELVSDHFLDSRRVSIFPD